MSHSLKRSTTIKSSVMLNFLLALLEYHDDHAEAFKLTLRCLLNVKHAREPILLKESLQGTLAVLFDLPKDIIMKLILQDLSADKINKWWTYIRSAG